MSEILAAFIDFNNDEHEYPDWHIWGTDAEVIADINFFMHKRPDGFNASDMADLREMIGDIRVKARRP